MSRLTEKYIQQQSVEFLTQYYEGKFNINKIYSRQEVRTNEKFFNKRADGLLCFHSKLQKEHTISIEAKSHKTLGSLLAYWNDHKLMKQILLFIIPIGLLTIYFSFSLPWYWIVLITLGTILMTFFIFIMTIVFLELDQHKIINVVNQVKQYPANEKWIAISKDSLNLTDKKKTEFKFRSSYDNFIRVCKNQNIGILVVTRKKNEILLEPKYIKGDFLDCYSKNKQIRGSLN